MLRPTPPPRAYRSEGKDLPQIPLSPRLWGDDEFIESSRDISQQPPPIRMSQNRPGSPVKVYQGRSSPQPMSQQILMGSSQKTLYLASQIASPRPMSYPPQLSSPDMSFHRNRLGDWVGVPQGIGLSFNCFMGQAPLIAKVEPGSHAYHAGLLMGDRMLSVSATTTISTIRTEVKGFDAEQLIGLLRQTFDTASKCGGKMIFQVERFQDGAVKVLEKVFENMGSAPLQYVPSPNPTSQQILVGSPQNTYYQGAVPWTMPSMIISSPPPHIASPRPNYNSQISVGSQAGIGLVFGRGRYQPASSEYTWNDPSDQTGSLFIMALDPNGPAAKSGRLEPMQELIAIDGWSVDGQAIDTVSQRIRGKAGTPVTLQVFLSRELCSMPIPRSTQRLNFVHRDDCVVTKKCRCSHRLPRGDNFLKFQSIVSNCPHLQLASFILHSTDLLRTAGSCTCLDPSV